MSYFNIIGEDCENIIYEYLHQLNFSECLKDIEKIDYSIQEGCGGVIHGIRKLEEDLCVDYCDWVNFHGFSAERKTLFRDGRCCYDDYESYMRIYSYKNVMDDDCVFCQFEECAVDSGFATEEEIQEAKNDDTYVEIDEDELYLKKKSFYVDTYKSVLVK